MTRFVAGGLLFVTICFTVWINTVLADTLRATGDLGVVVERSSGSLLIVDQSERAVIGRVEGLGRSLSCVSRFSPDQRFAFVFGRDGGLSKVDMLTGEIVGRVMQAGNSIGGAISQDGSLIAVSNYDPGGVRVFDSRTLEPVADIPATYRRRLGAVEGGRSGRCAGSAFRLQPV